MLADALERYGAGTLGDLPGIWRARGNVIDVDRPVEAAARNELAGVPEVSEWLVLVVMKLAGGLDNPEAEPYHHEFAAELARALQGLHEDSGYRPRLRSI